jgi:hypothetical protein
MKEGADTQISTSIARWRVSQDFSGKDLGG